MEGGAELIHSFPLINYLCDAVFTSQTSFLEEARANAMLTGSWVNTGLTLNVSLHICNLL